MFDWEESLILLNSELYWVEVIFNLLSQFFLLLHYIGKQSALIVQFSLPFAQTIKSFPSPMCVLCWKQH